jgi:inosine-uridine nucleoside N-ribohydrolase
MDLNRRHLLGAGLAIGALALTETAGAAEPGVGDHPLPRLLDNHRILIDTDPGNDDSVAILMALAAPHLKVEAITVCPGNIRYDQELKNALYMVELAGKAGQIPVHAGMRKPLLDKPYPTATFIHGPDGLGEFRTPPVRQQLDPEHAVDAIRRIVRTYPGEVVIAALGGLTNVAMALLIEPDLAGKIKGIQWVAGAGNAIPGFNALVDPEAAQVVLNSGVALTLGLGSPGSSILTPADFAVIERFDTPKSRFFIASNRQRLTFEMTARNAPGSVNGDPLAMAMIIDPSIATEFKPIYAHVELAGEFTRGDILYGENRYNMKPTPPANCNLCIQASNEGFKKVLFATLSAH